MLPFICQFHVPYLPVGRVADLLGHSPAGGVLAGWPAAKKNFLFQHLDDRELTLAVDVMFPLTLRRSDVLQEEVCAVRALCGP